MMYKNNRDKQKLNNFTHPKELVNLTKYLSRYFLNIPNIILKIFWCFLQYLEIEIFVIS